MRSLPSRYLAKDPSARALQIAGLVRFACLFLQGIILVKAGVPLQVVGQIELVFFLVNFFQFFWQIGGHQAMLSWKTGTEERVRAAGAIFGGMHIQALAGTAVLLIVALLQFHTKFASLLQGSNLVGLSVYVFFSIPVGAILYGYLVRDQHQKILWYTGITQGVQVILVVGMMVAGRSIGDLIKVLAVFAVLRWVAVLLLGTWFADGLPRLRYSWAFFVFAIPLVLHAFYGGLMDYVDGWIVSVFFGEETFALYRYGARELPLNALLIGGLTSGLIHRFKSANGVDSEALKHETGRIMKVLFPINCVLILGSPFLYTLLYSSEFVLSARIFNIYVLTLLSRVVLNQVYCYVEQANWVLAWSTAAEIVLNIVLSLVLLKWIGLLGIPVATVIAYALQKAYLIRYVRKHYGIPLAQYVPLKPAVFYYFGLIGCTIAAELLYFN